MSIEAAHITESDRPSVSERMNARDPHFCESISSDMPLDMPMISAAPFRNTSPPALLAARYGKGVHDG